MIPEGIRPSCWRWRCFVWNFRFVMSYFLQNLGSVCCIRFRLDGDCRLVIVISFDDCHYSHFQRLTSSLSNLVEFRNVTLVIFPTSQIIDLII